MISKEEIKETQSLIENRINSHEGLARFFGVDTKTLKKFRELKIELDSNIDNQLKINLTSYVKIVEGLKKLK